MRKLTYCRDGRLPKTSLDELLANRRIAEDGCWLWTKGTNQFGYGRAMLTYGNGETQAESVHRIAFVYHKGQTIPAGQVVLHTCDNRACINPDHLKLGTQAENLADMYAKGRDVHTKRAEANRKPPPTVPPMLTGDKLMIWLRQQAPLTD